MRGKQGRAGVAAQPRVPLGHPAVPVEGRQHRPVLVTSYRTLSDVTAARAPPALNFKTVAAPNRLGPPAGPLPSLSFANGKAALCARLANQQRAALSPPHPSALPLPVLRQWEREARGVGVAAARRQPMGARARRGRERPYRRAMAA